MIRIIHTNDEVALSQRAVACIPVLLKKQETKKEDKISSLTGAIEIPEKEDENFEKDPWLPFVKELIQDLKDTAENIAENCLGLAANQIWVAESYGQEPGTPPPAVFIMRWPDTAKLRKWDWKAILNPSIKPTGKTLRKVESCLSFPDKTKKTSRGKNAIMHWQTEDSFDIQRTHLREIQGPYAQIVQHENDHLNGKHI